MNSNLTIFSAVQGKGMSINNEQKKSILNKLFKGKLAGPNTMNQTVYQGVNSTFNEQLMNQTNFGFNPARQTIVGTPNSTSHPKDGLMFMDTTSSVTGRRELNTQKRNRT